MSLSLNDLVAFSVAVCAILMVGSTHLRTNIFLFSLQAMLLVWLSTLYANHHAEQHLYLIALVLFALKAVGVPLFLLRIIRQVNVQRDSGTLLSAPIAMHVALAFLAVSYILARQLPVPIEAGLGWPGATAAISLVCTGLLLMLTRRIALSQIIGFLVMENGIYLFGLTQTKGMPMLVEMGIMLDVLVGVMIAGLLAFRIQKSFEHIDVSMLVDLKE